MTCTVVIPAAGSGLRFGTDTPKQFLALRGRPILVHTVERFLQFDEVLHVVICVASGQIDTVRQMARQYGWDRTDVIPGGATRQESVAFGVRVASGFPAPLVAVHDSVRPFFSPRTFRALLESAGDVGAALPAIPLKETIHRVTGNRIVETANRAEWCAAQTPQVFRIETLRLALARAEAEGFEGTDEASVVSRYGHPVEVVPGDASNLKITLPEDLEIAEANFERWRLP